MLAIAVILTLISGILSGIGHSIQRYGLNTLPELTPRAFYQRHIKLMLTLFTTPVWLLGGVLAVSGALLRWQAFSSGDVSLLKPLTNINILIVVMVGIFFLNEHLGRSEWIGISGLLGGVIILSLFSEERVIETYNLPWFILSTAICFTFVVIMIIIGSQQGRSTQDKELFFALGAGVLYGIATIFLKAMTIEVIQIIGYFSVLDPLALLTLLNRIPFWLYVASSVVAYLLLQCAYSCRRVSVAFPVNNSLSTLVPILIAVIVFQDNLFIPINGFLLFPISYLRIIGIIAIIIGILLLQRFQGKALQTPLNYDSFVNSSVEEEIKGLS
ncbi:MAG: DMT family transporter [Candidatus Thorarchaeota archaeon]